MSAAPEPRPRMRARYSLRLRVFAAVTVSTLLLPLVVFIASQLERRVPVGLWQKTLEATDEAALTVEAYSNPDASRFVAIAAKHNARIRVVPRVEGDPPIDADRDDPRDALHPIEAFFFLNRSRATSKDFDAVTPVLARPETSYAIAKGLYIDCFKEGAPGVPGRARPEGSRGAHVRRVRRQELGARSRGGLLRAARAPPASRS
jgi:hypothetical protein